MTKELRALAIDCKHREIDFDDVLPQQGSTSCDKLVRHYIAASSPDAILALLNTIESHKLAMREALDALKESIDLVDNDYIYDWRHGLPTREAQLEGKRKGVDDHKAAIAALEKELNDSGDLTNVSGPLPEEGWDK